VGPRRLADCPRAYSVPVVLSVLEGARRGRRPAPPTPALAGGTRVAGLTLGLALRGAGEQPGRAALAWVLRECVFVEGAGRAGLLTLDGEGFLETPGFEREPAAPAHSGVLWPGCVGMP
jgi:hypothetical protein